MSDQAAEGILSGYLRDKRLKKALPWIKGRILDWGCGSGKLANFVTKDCYYGYDISLVALAISQKKFPNHLFSSVLPNQHYLFDTIVMLALIEHVKDPINLLKDLHHYLVYKRSSRVIITTPHPSMDFIHKAGAMIGLFSKAASEEHETLINKNMMIHIAREAGFRVVHYEKFLFGANQLIILEPYL